jgi:carbon storage regulator
MLVLSRKWNERIIIGDNIIITVVDIRGDHIRLGIEAPLEVSVHREEVYIRLSNPDGQARETEAAEGGASRG